MCMCYFLGWQLVAHHILLYIMAGLIAGEIFLKQYVVKLICIVYLVQYLQQYTIIAMHCVLYLLMFFLQKTVF